MKRLAWFALTVICVLLMMQYALAQPPRPNPSTPSRGSGGGGNLQITPPAPDIPLDGSRLTEVAPLDQQLAPESGMIQTQIAVTVDAVKLQVQETIAAEVETTLNDELTMLDVSIEGNTARITATIDEIQINAAVDTVLEAAGYGDLDVVVDLVNNGVVVIVDNYTLDNGMTVTVVLEYELTSNGSDYDLILVSATANDVPVSTDEVDGTMTAYLESYMEDIIGGSTTDVASQVPDATGEVTYEVESILITDNLVATIIVVSFEV